MKLRLTVFYIICLGLLLLSCRQNNAATLNYHTLSYDTNRITILKWDTTKYSSNNSDPLALTQEDLAVIDSFLKDAIDSFNTRISPGLYQAFDGKFPVDSFVIKPEKYRYQYILFKDVNGQRIVTIIGFSTDFQPWKTEIYRPRLHYGMRMLELKVNLSEKTRDNLRSGNFG